MGIESEVKKLAHSKWFYLFVGVIVGGTVLAYPVALAVGFIRSKIPFLRRAGADNTAAVAAGKV